MSGYPRALPSAEQKAQHSALMGRAFPRYRHPVPRGSRPVYPAGYAAEFGDENEATPDAVEELSAPESGFVYGASLTCFPRQPDPFLVA